MELNNGMPFDENGRWAATGTVNSELLECLLADSFFAQTYPKSTGTDYFNIAWLKRHFSQLHELNTADVQATLLALTCESIAQQLETLSQTASGSAKLYVCGGGVQNSALMLALSKRLATVQVQSTDELGLPANWLEAIGFAWLGYCKDHNIASNCPSVTGASSEVVLGQIFSPS